MADSDSRRKPIEVILPPEPPELTPAAARALLKVLVKAYERSRLEKRLRSLQHQRQETTRYTLRDAGMLTASLVGNVQPPAPDESADHPTLATSSSGSSPAPLE